MDFDFTDDDGHGTTVEADTPGIYLTVTDDEGVSAEWLTPTEARAIAEALTTAANHVEEAN